MTEKRPNRDMQSRREAGGTPSRLLEVLEKHADFLRDFRGDTIHPSTLEILAELGLAERLLQLRHAKAPVLKGRIGGREVVAVDFRRLDTPFPYIAFVPQWDFLDMIVAEARRCPTFRLEQEAEVTDLIWQRDVVRGVRYWTRGGEREAAALLTIGADGRGSATRSAAGLEAVGTSAPMDVLWFRLSRRPTDSADSIAVIKPGRIVALINRFEYWQIGWVIPKAGEQRVRTGGLAAFRAEAGRVLPELANRVGEIASWDDVRLLSVQSNRLSRWYRPGYLAIGDAAHAMSPIRGAGINLAVQDAVAAANRLHGPLARQRFSTADLAAVQARREWPTRVTQLAHTLVQELVLRGVLGLDGAPRLPPGLGPLVRLPGARDLPARMIGFGVQREHVTPELREAGYQAGVRVAQ